MLNVNCFNGNYFTSPVNIRNKSDKPFKVFTPFWKECLSKIGENDVVPTTNKPLGVIDISLNKLEDLGLLENKQWESKIADKWKISELSAVQVLNNYIEHAHVSYDKIETYHH